MSLLLALFIALQEPGDRTALEACVVPLLETANAVPLHPDRPNTTVEEARDVCADMLLRASLRRAHVDRTPNVVDVVIDYDGLLGLRVPGADDFQFGPRVEGKVFYPCSKIGSSRVYACRTTPPPTFVMHVRDPLGQIWKAMHQPPIFLPKVLGRHDVWYELRGRTVTYEGAYFFEVTEELLELQNDGFESGTFDAWSSVNRD